MLTQAQVEEYTLLIPEETDGEDRRAAYATITGFKDDKSINEIASYYSLQQENVVYWWNFFNFSSTEKKVVGKRGSKTKKIEDYLVANVGKEVTPTQVANEIGMSLPTFYNYLNANRHLFKKVKRGVFEILNPKEVGK